MFDHHEILKGCKRAGCRKRKRIGMMEIFKIDVRVPAFLEIIRLLFITALAALCFCSATATPQTEAKAQSKKAKHAVVAPTYADVAYDIHERTVLDFGKLRGMVHVQLRSISTAAVGARSIRRSKKELRSSWKQRSPSLRSTIGCLTMASLYPPPFMMPPVPSSFCASKPRNRRLIKIGLFLPVAVPVVVLRSGSPLTMTFPIATPRTP